MNDTPTTTLLVVRHGETQWNLEGRWQGHLDSDLTELGQRQARALAKHPAMETVDRVYSSDLGRALATAHEIAVRRGLGIHREPRLRERHLGIFQGLTRAEMTERFPEEVARMDDPT